MSKHVWPVPALVFVVIWGLTTHGKFSVTGDEPHYLLMAESLRADGDLDLANDYASPSSARFGPEAIENDGHALPDRHGVLRSKHEPALAVLLLPVYTAAVGLADLLPPARLASVRMTRGLFVYALVSLSMLGLTCLALGLLTATLMRRVPAGHARAAVWLVAFSPPLLGNAFLVFPEVPALLVVCLTLWSAFGAGRDRSWTIAVCAAAMGLLPWLHRKFAPFAIGLLFVLLWERRRELAAAPARLAAGLLAFALPVAACLVDAWLQWGTIMGPIAREGSPLSWRAFPSGALALLLDREYGLLIWAPIYVAAFVAWWHMRHATWTLLVPAFLLYLPSAANLIWWGGFAPAARFLVPLVPLFAFVLAPALTRPAFVRALAVLCVPQLVISAIGWQRPRFLWPRDDGTNRVLEAVPGIGPLVNDVLPSFRGPLDPAAIAVTVALFGGAAVAIHYAMSRSAAPDANATSPGSRAGTS
jgi:hypothetical protein